MGPACPACKTRIPFRRTQMDLGKPFACESCGTELVVPRGQNWVFMIGLFALFWLIKSQFISHWSGTLALMAGISLIGLPALYLKTQARLAAPSDTKKPPRA